MNSLNDRIAFSFFICVRFCRLKKGRKEADDEVGIFLGALAFYIVPLHCYKVNIQ